MAKKDNFPLKYTDPRYFKADDATAAKLGLPAGLLQSIRINGERSNADQVSSAGGSTPYQFIPATRKAILDKYGIDVTLSPENASEGAGLLLRDSLQRNNGDVETAVREYHAGVKRENWGKVNDAYAGRVLKGYDTSKIDALSNQFQQFLAANPATPPVQTSANGVAAGPTGPIEGLLQPGNIDLTKRPQVKNPDGSISTVRSIGVNIDGKEVLIPTVSDDGKLLSDKQAIAQYQKTGKHLGIFNSPEASTNYAENLHTQQEKFYGTDDPLNQKFAAFLAAQNAPPVSGAAAIPEAVPGARAGLANAPAAPAKPGLVDQLIGAGETGLALATGATGGALGALGGLAGGLAGAIANGDLGTQQGVSNIGEAAAKGAEALTYTPRTQAGQQQTGAIGEALNAAVPVLPLTAELGAIGQGAGRAAQAAQDATANSVARIRQAAPQIAERVQRTLARNPEPQAAQTAGGSVGAAGADIAAQRQAQAGNLPAPIDLTLGERTRSPEQLKFEVETSKLPEGQKLRERVAENNQRIYQNFDAYIDETGAQATTLRQTGLSVDDALVKKAENAKNQIRVAAKKAFDSDEAQLQVDPGEAVQIGQGDRAIQQSVTGYLNSKPAGLNSTGLLDDARKFAIRLGIAEQGEDGLLVAKPATVAKMEEFRREINGAVGYEKPDIRDATILKGLIDAQTEPVAGPLFRDYRRLRENYAKQFENRSVINKLLTTKRGTSDRNVALEDVFDHAILNGSLDQVREVRRTLMGHSVDTPQAIQDAGNQAWRDLQGQTVAYLRDQTFRRSARDANLNPVASADAFTKAVDALDKEGKLDFVLGKKGAENIRDFRDVVQLVKTAPPEAAINTSNTAATILGAFADAGISGSLIGLPVPVLTTLRYLANRSKDIKLRKRIDDALARQPRTPRQP